MWYTMWYKFGTCRRMPTYARAMPSYVLSGFIVGRLPKYLICPAPTCHKSACAGISTPRRFPFSISRHKYITALAYLCNFSGIIRGQVGDKSSFSNNEVHLLRRYPHLLPQTCLLSLSDTLLPFPAEFLLLHSKH